eukprot:4390979-Pleurochrysis_carterae.AAC.1
MCQLKSRLDRFPPRGEQRISQSILNLVSSARLYCRPFVHVHARIRAPVYAFAVGHTSLCARVHAYIHARRCILA